MKSLLHTTAVLALTIGNTLPIAFDTGGSWKLDADGKIELKDGNPIFVDSAGNEQTVNGGTISKLNAESKTHREAKEKAQADLAKFEGLDPDAARKAIDTVKNIDAKKLIDSGEVDTLKEQMKGEFTAQLTEKDAKIAELTSSLDNTRLDNVFANSEFLRTSIAVPRDMLEASMRRNFKIEDGKAVAYDNSGNRLLSKQNAGEPATPEEALRILIEARADKDAILKAEEQGGSGGQGGGGNRGQGRTMKRSDYDALDAGGKAAAATAMGKQELTIVD